MVELAELDLYSCTERFETVSISTTHRVGTQGNRHINAYKNRQTELHLSLKECLDWKLNQGKEKCIIHFPGVSATTTYPPTEKYSRNMLTIHKPWCKDRPLMKPPGKTWRAELEDFMKGNPPTELRIDMERAKNNYEMALKKAAMPKGYHDENTEIRGLPEEEYDPQYDLISEKPVDLDKYTQSPDFFLGGEDHDWSKVHYTTKHSLETIDTWLECNANKGTSDEELQIPLMRNKGKEGQHYTLDAASGDQKQVITRVLETLVKHQKR